MAIRLTLPDCSACGAHGSAFWQSERWPDVRICYDCRDAVVEWFFTAGINQHIILTDLVKGSSIDDSDVSGVFFPEHPDGIKKSWRVWYL